MSVPPCVLDRFFALLMKIFCKDVLRVADVVLPILKLLLKVSFFSIHVFSESLFDLILRPLQCDLAHQFHKPFLGLLGLELEESVIGRIFCAE